MNLLTRLAATLRWHRRPVAALLAALLVWVTLAVLTSSRAQDTASVLVAARLVPAGTMLAKDDVRVSSLPKDAVPEGALTSVDRAVGHVVGSGLRPGQMLTDLSLVAGGPPEGRLVVGVKVSDPDMARLAPPGTRVTLYGAASVDPVVSHVLVVAVPAGTADAFGTSSRVGMIMVDVSPAEAGALARAMASSSLTVAIG